MQDNISVMVLVLVCFVCGYILQESNYKALNHQACLNHNIQMEAIRAIASPDKTSSVPMPEECKK